MYLVHTRYSTFDDHQIFIEYLLYALGVEWGVRFTNILALLETVFWW